MSHGFGIDVKGEGGCLMGLGLTLREKGVSRGCGIDVKGEGGCLMGLGLTLRGKGGVSWVWD